MCEECGNNHTEKHHIIFRSQCRLIDRFYLNIKKLCPKCHRGNEGPHRNRAKDLEYKKEYQRAVEKLIRSEYYTDEGLKKTLKMNGSQLSRITRLLKVYPEGYQRDEIIFLLCGNRNYL